MAIIEALHVTKHYPTRRGARVLLGRGGLSDWLRGRRRTTFAALDDVSFEIEAGESFGIIGANGSGKSTLLKILAGVTVPTTGHVRVHGRVASLLELGAGFHPMLTGRENVYLNAGIMGMRHAQVDRVFDDIVRFSGIGDFIDNPVDTYSSGMYVRIAFAVAVYANPDIFLVDEVLSVGDEEFQRKCRQRIGELREQGKTIVFVSHDLGIVNTLCNRAVLLTKGKMVSRGTPRATIDYYLRQIGREQGIHSFESDGVEALFSNGRISLFRGHTEITAPAGLGLMLESMGQQHHSAGGDWRIVEQSATSCRARGRMPRLPVSCEWDMRLEGRKLVWKAALDCEMDTVIDAVDTSLFLPTGYTHWHYGDLEGPFPDLQPSDMTWISVVAPENTCTEAAAVPAQSSALPVLDTRIVEAPGYFRLQWANTDYVTGCRALSFGGRLPDTQIPLTKGRHDLFSLEIEVGLTPEELRARIETRQRARVVRAGGLAARVEHGRIRLSAEGQDLTTFLHLYASLLIGNLWNDSQNFVLTGLQETDTGLRFSGESRRFPGRMDWELAPEGDAIGLTLWMENQEPLEIQEYQTSIVLRAEYDRWETGQEQGVFPAFTAGDETWRHINRDYTPGTHITALSSTLPSVRLETATDQIPFRMTAINTGYSQNARVLQALRTPDAGWLRWEPGRHLYFRGRIRLVPGPKLT